MHACCNKEHLNSHVCMSLYVSVTQGVAVYYLFLLILLRLLQSLELFQERITLPSSSPRTNATGKAVTFQRHKFGVIVTELNTNNFSNQTFAAQLSEAGVLSDLSIYAGNISKGNASIFVPDSLMSKCPQNTRVRISYNIFLNSVFFQADTSSPFGSLIATGNLSVGRTIMSVSACKGSLIENLEEHVIIEFPKPTVRQ